MLGSLPTGKDDVVGRIQGSGVKELKSQEEPRARHWWLTSVILATQEAEIRRIMVRSQSKKIVHKTLSHKYLSQKGLAEWLKVKALSSSPSTAKKKKQRPDSRRSQAMDGGGGTGEDQKS
jgi:hypothetical protein